MAISGKEEILSYARERKKLCSDLKELIVEQLCLDMDPRFLTDDQPLFGRGLELDSIDSLELVVGIFNHFQVTINDEETAAFSSVNALADYVIAHQGQENQVNVDAGAGGFIDLDGL